MLRGVAAEAHSLQSDDNRSVPIQDVHKLRRAKLSLRAIGKAAYTRAAHASSTMEDSTAAPPPAVVIKDLTFAYAPGAKPVLRGINLELPAGSRTLLVGENGVGKSTLLRLLAGKHIHKEGAVQVLGSSSFFDTFLPRAHLTTDWGKRTVAFSGHGISLTADIAVGEMLAAWQLEFRERRDELVALLGIDLEWRLHQLSDGQRRRVQIMIQLLHPVKLLLLDEITTDLDLLTRQDFLSHLKVMSVRDGVTVVYATHIFDGLDDWPTHLAFISQGEIPRFGTIDSYEDLAQRRAAGVVAPLLRTIETWMRNDRDKRRAAGFPMLEKAAGVAVDELRGVGGNGYLSGRIGMGGADGRGGHN